MRVGIIALQHESNTFLPGKTTLDDFRRGTLARGADIVRHFGDAHHEVGGFFQGLNEAGIEAVPLFAARATPGGTVAADAYHVLLEMMTASLDAAGTLDGLLVAPHGAGVCESEPDMDGHWLSMLRERFRDRIPIISTLDPHANLSARMVAACDATIAYRTNPHLDQRQRGLEAAALMARTLRGEVKPTQAAAFPRVTINIACQETDAPPCSTLMQRSEAQRRYGGVLSNSVMLGFPYADVPEMGSAFVAVTDNDPGLAQKLADEMAAWLVEHRRDFVGDLPSVEVAVAKAMTVEESVCLLDVGDNIGGGSPGDSTLIAQALDARGTGRAFVCLFDPPAVQRVADAQAGGTLELTVGRPPMRAIVTVRGIYDGRFTESQPRHGGKTSYDMGQTAIVETKNGLTIMLTSRRTPPFSLNQLRSCGLDPTSFRVLVAKGVNAPIAAYREVCNHFIRVNTPGVTTADMTTLEFGNRRRPMFPFEELP